MSRRSSELLLLTVSTLAVLTSACSKGSGAPVDNGGLIVTVSSDLSLPEDLDRIRVQATVGMTVLLDEDHLLGPGQLLIPAQFRVKSTGNSSPVVVRGVGYKDGVARIERSAVTPIPTDRLGAVRLALNYLCDGTAATQPDGSVVSTCPGGLTCVQGTCKNSTVPPASLPTYDPMSAPGAGGAGGAMMTNSDGGVTAGGCFDAQSCFAAPVDLMVDPATCTATLPVGTDPASLNVALQLPPGGKGVCGPTSCWIVFDQGADWTVAGSTLQLPAGACASPSATLVLSTACHAKLEAQPTCGPWSSVMTPASQPMGMPSSPVGKSCAGVATQACGLCGMQARTCTNGAWSTWGACAGEGACLAASTRACGANGVQACGADCQWGACGCPGDQTTCAGTCTSVQTDVHNCGQCGTDCTLLPHIATASAACGAGRCSYSCTPGYADCGQTGQGCAASLSAVGTCGRCDAACAGAAPTCAPVASGAGGASGGASYACASGCSAPAPTLCAGSCVDLASSAENCGKCGNACPGGATCQGNQCLCPTGTTLCGDRCADLSSENASCGKCGNACPDGATCHDGVCACVGPTTQSCGACGTQLRTCTDGKWSSWTDCTAVGSCAAGTTKACTNGTQTCDMTCQWSSCQCATGFQTCGGACVNLKADNGNCGTCGHLCPGGQACQAGVCTCAGTASLACGNTCVDPKTDKGNCGTCGHSCASGVCQNGACTCTGPASQSCGTKCGTQTRTCNDGTWSAWSACGAEGPCSPNDVVACNTTGAMTCNTSCQWGSCIMGCTGPASEACGNCGTHARTCNLGQWSAWTSCAGEGPCASGATLECGNGGKQTCGTACQWGGCAEPDRNATAWPATGPQLTVLSDTVIEQVSKLEWQRAFSVGVSQASAAANCATLNLNGAGRWRLPSLAELFSIVDLNRVDPSIDTSAFPGVARDNFVTSNGIVLYFGVGTDSSGSTGNARCVRDAVANRVSSPSYSFPATGVAHDDRSGLTWQLGVSATMVTNAVATGVCPSLNLGGFASGWRLPTGRELESIRNPTTSNRQVISQFGAAVNLWSSTLYAFSATSAWALLQTGIMFPQAVGNPYFVRCVHD